MNATRRTMLGTLTLVAGLAGPAAAGESGWTPAFEAGGTLARFRVSPVPPGEDDPFDDRLGFYAGASVSVSNGTAGLRLGAAFVRKGTEIPGDPETITWDAFEVPVAFELRPTRGSVRPLLSAGMALSRRLDVRSSQFQDGDLDDDDVFTATDVGAFVGAGVEAGRFDLEARYTWGLRNLVADSSTVSLKSRALTFGLRFRP
jgi:Outer membrane protein beta-barrel domain